MLHAKGIHKKFEQLEVLKGIDLDINDGEFVAIVGPSGAGKTTLLQIIGSLDRPDSGSVSYDIEGFTGDIFAMRDARLARFRNLNIGFVFQFHQLLPEFSMLENIAMPALIAGRPRKESFEAAREIIAQFGLTNRETHRPAQLSGGERQRAAVARAIINSPKIVLADEPSGSLDSANRNELHKLFLDIRDRLGTTFVTVTHDSSLASIADRVITMRDGLIINE